jgi:actin-related protein 3
MAGVLYTMYLIFIMPIQNVVLSGGSTLFPGLAERLERELGCIVQNRLSSHDNTHAVNRQDRMQVSVKTHANQKHAVWCGGALLASLPDFGKQCVKREEYHEYGPSICRSSRVLTMC